MCKKIRLFFHPFTQKTSFFLQVSKSYCNFVNSKITKYYLYGIYTRNTKLHAEVQRAF